MNLLIQILIVIVSFYLMAKIVDDHFIKSLDIIASKLNLPPSVSGATLMAMGTSAPELSTALFAFFLSGAEAAVGVGTIVGSAIFQILVVIGFAAVVKTSYLNWKPVIRDGLFYTITIALLILFVRDGIFTVYESGSFILTYLVYLGVLFYWTKNIDEDNPNIVEVVDEGLHKAKEKSLLQNFLAVITKPLDMFLDLIPDAKKSNFWTYTIFFSSLGIIAYLSYILVLAAQEIAVIMGIPTAVIALTVLAGGSSIPEMIGSVVVSKQGRGDMAISNAIGSNIFDISISLGLPLFLYNLSNGDLHSFGGENITSSIFLLFVTMVAVIMLLIAQKFRVGKVFGGILITMYVAYVIAAYSGLL